MMPSGNCNCSHHWVTRILVILAWAAGILFFWSTLAGRIFWGFDAGYWAWSVVILVLLAKTSMGCRCCCGDKHCATCPVK